MGRFVSKTHSVEDMDPEYGTNEVVDPTQVDNHDDGALTNVEEVNPQEVALLDTTETPEALSVGAHSEIVSMREGFTEAENLVDLDDELSAVAVEMLNILDSRKEFTRAEMMIIDLTTARVTKKLNLPCQMVGFEDFKPLSDKEALSEISMEGIISSLSDVVDAIYNRLDQAIANSVGFFKSFTPSMAARKKRAEDLLYQVNNSHREAGQKEVTGNFVSQLLIDGDTPEPKTVLNTLKLLRQIDNEFLDEDAGRALKNALDTAMSEMTRDMGADDVSNPSKFWYLGYLLLPSIMSFAGGQIGGLIGGTAGHIGGAVAGRTTMQLSFLQGTVFRSAVLKGMTLNDKNLPPLKTVYPTLAKTGLGFTDDERVENRRSDFLFGNKYFRVSDLAYGRAMRNVGRLHGIAKINKAQLGVHLDSTRGKGGMSASSLRTLTSKEQAEVLSNVIMLIEDSISFYKNYGARADQRYQAWRAAFSKVKEVYDGAFVSPGRALGLSGLRAVLKHIVNLYWSGIYETQVEYIKYLNRTSDALMNYVLASNRATRAEEFK